MRSRVVARWSRGDCALPAAHLSLCAPVAASLPGAIESPEQGLADRYTGLSWWQRP